MKTISLLIRQAMVVALVAIIAACSSDEKNHATVIPSDAFMVGSLDLKSVAQKGNLSELNNNATVKKLKQEMTKGVSKESATLVNEILENPTASGIDFNKKMYLFAQMGGNKTSHNVNSIIDTPSCVGAAIPVKSRDAVTKMLSTLATEAGVTPPTESGLGYLSMKLESDFTLTYNDFVLLLLKKEQGEAAEEAKKLMTQESATSIYPNLTFIEMEKKRSDIAMMVNFQAIPTTYYNQMYGENPFEEGCEMKDLGLVCGLTFDNGSMTLSAETLLYSEAWRNSIKKAEKITNKLGKRFLQYVPSDAAMVAGVNLDGKLYQEEFQPMLTKAFQSLALLGETGEIYAELLNSLTALQGDAVAYVKLQGVEDISAQAFMEGDEQEMSELLAEIPSFLQVDKGSKENYSYIAYNAADAGGKRVKNSFAETPAGELFSQSHAALYLSFNAVNQVAPQLMGRRQTAEQKMALDALAQIDYTLFTQQSPTKVEWKLVMANKQENALKIYMDKIGAMITQ